MMFNPTGIICRLSLDSICDLSVDSDSDFVFSIVRPASNRLRRKRISIIQGLAYLVDEPVQCNIQPTTYLEREGPEKVVEYKHSSLLGHFETQESVDAMYGHKRIVEESAKLEHFKNRWETGNSGFSDVGNKSMIPLFKDKFEQKIGGSLTVAICNCLLSTLPHSYREEAKSEFWETTEGKYLGNAFQYFIGGLEYRWSCLKAKGVAQMNRFVSFLEKSKGSMKDENLYIYSAK